MNREVTTFDFKGTANVRVVEIDGQPWFVAADVCKTLDLRAGSDGSFSRHLVRLSADERREVMIPTSQNGGYARGGKRVVVSESGLYKLILRSDKPQAHEFQDWVTRVVLPAIRQNGGYIAGQEKLLTGEMDDRELLARAFIVAQRTIEGANARADQAEAKVEQLSAERNYLTLDAYRAFARHTYWNHSFRVRVGQVATRLTLARGLKPGKEERTIRWHGAEKTVFVNIYERSILDEAVRMLGGIAA